MKNMKKIKQGDPAPFDGYIITYPESNKIIQNKRLLNWVNDKIKEINSNKQ
jgi:hypothetical protein